MDSCNREVLIVITKVYVPFSQCHADAHVIPTLSVLQISVRFSSSTPPTHC